MKTIKISTYPLKLKSFDNQKKVYDVIRKKYVAFTPEEFVRQNIIIYLIEEKKYSINLISVEHPLKQYGTIKRCDIVIFNKNTKAKMIIECKAPAVKLTQNTIDQAANYNIKLKVEYLVITNGNDTICYKLDFDNNTFEVTEEIPDFNILNY